MFDATLRPYIDPPLNQLGGKLASRGITANLVTVSGLAFGTIAATAIIFEQFLIGLIFILASRFCDGLDGAVARATRKTDLGGYLDIVFDFFFYGAIPLAFVIQNPAQNGLPGAILLAAFYANGASFLTYAIMAAKRGMATEKRGSKSLYFTGGLAEGFETIAVFCAFCVFPSAFPVIAYAFAVICVVTTISRVLLALQTLE